MTLSEVEALKIGDTITTFHSGIFKFVRSEPSYLTHYDFPVTESFCACYGAKNRFGEDWKIGDLYQYLLVYTKIFTDDFKPVKGKSENRCSQIFCQKVDVNELRAAKISNLKSEIERLEYEKKFN